MDAQGLTGSPLTTTRTSDPMPHDEAAHRRAANRAVAVSAVGLALTGGIELAAALLTGSVGLLGDALHNLSDVSTSAVVFWGFWVSKRPPTSRYPYGFERAEDLAGLGVALVVWASAAFAGFESYRKLVDHAPTTYLGVGMAGAVIGIVGNQVVASYKGRVGNQIQSATLRADARHSRLDALSSVGALGGLIAVALGYRIGDPIAGFAVTVFICHVGYEVTSEMTHHLMDGVDPSDTEAAASAARAVPGVIGATARGRWMGRSLLIEVEGTIDGSGTLAGACEVGELVEHAVRSAVSGVRRVVWRPTPISVPVGEPAPGP